MKSILLPTLGAALLCACATNSPTTSWGKEGVSMTDYRLDGAQCAVLAATAESGNNQANTAGGITGKNSGAGVDVLPPQTPGRSPTAAFPVGGSVYRENASSDFVSRAANAQRARELEDQRFRTEMLKSCLVDRGYTQFALTPEQRRKLATLPEGSDARRQYLYELGTDPATLAKARKGS